MQLGGSIIDCVCWCVPDLALTAVFFGGRRRQLISGSDQQRGRYLDYYDDANKFKEKQNVAFLILVSLLQAEKFPTEISKLV